MRDVTPQELLADLKTNRPIRIKIMSMGENIGLDFGFLCHFYCLKKAFPNITLDMIRSNVAETNRIGFGRWENIVKLPLDSMKEVFVRQWYEDRSDWLRQIEVGNFNIIEEQNRSIVGYDYYWGINVGDRPNWTRQYPQDFPLLRPSTVHRAIFDYVAERPDLFNVENPLQDLPLNVARIKGSWDRTLCEALCFGAPDYPWSWVDPTPAYSDYIHVGLRWPDNTRWYYSIEQQKDTVRRIIRGIKQCGRPVKMIYNLKDMELNNNFNRGQDLFWLQEVNNSCDDILFTYCWNPIGMPNRPSKESELDKLRRMGIHEVKEVSVWEEMKMCCDAKVYLSEPAGMAEAVYVGRGKKGHSTFVFPTCTKHGHACIASNAQGQTIALKVNPVNFDLMYDCDPIFSTGEPRELISWRVSYGQVATEMPIGYPGGDYYWYKDVVTPTTFVQFAEATKDTLVSAVVEEYIK